MPLIAKFLIVSGALLWAVFITVGMYALRFFKQNGEDYDRSAAERLGFAAETEGERSAAVPAPGFRPPGAGASTPGGES